MSAMTTKELQERIWDLEEQLDDSEAKNQSQAALIEVHVAQIRRLRGELRAKDRERHQTESAPTAANPVPTTESKDFENTEQKDGKTTEQKDVNDSEQDLEFEEMAKRPALFHGADDIREHIIEVKSSSTHILHGSTRVGHGGPEGLKCHASDDVSAEVKIFSSAIPCTSIAYPLIGTLCTPSLSQRSYWPPSSRSGRQPEGRI